MVKHIHTYIHTHSITQHIRSVSDKHMQSYIHTYIHTSVHNLVKHLLFFFIYLRIIPNMKHSFAHHVPLSQTRTCTWPSHIMAVYSLSLSLSDLCLFVVSYQNNNTFKSFTFYICVLLLHDKNKKKRNSTSPRLSVRPIYIVGSIVDIHQQNSSDYVTD